MLAPVVDMATLRQLPEAVLADVRWYADGRDAEQEYAAGHVAGAVFVDLQRWLSGPPSDAEGRHPLPEPEVFAEGMRRAGVGDADTVLAYDDVGGVVAARLVWMLRVIGHPAALLDGGLTAWDGPRAYGHTQPRRAQFTARRWPRDLLADIHEVAALAELAGSGEAEVLLDARSPERYAGQPDALDPRAGHIPGARNLSCRDHLGSDGRLLPEPTLRARFGAAGVRAGGPPVISSCGSGVTSCHNLLVLELLGLPAGRLYPGSWSQWSRSDRPAVQGPHPHE